MDLVLNACEALTLPIPQPPITALPGWWSSHSRNCAGLVAETTLA